MYTLEDKEAQVPKFVDWDVVIEQFSDSDSFSKEIIQTIAHKVVAGVN